MAEKQQNDKQQNLGVEIIGLLILGGLLLLLGCVLWLDHLRHNFASVLLGVFATAFIFTGILLIFGALNFKQAFHRISIWYLVGLVGLLAVCVAVLFASIEFNDEISVENRVKSFYIACFAFLMLIAGKTCIKAWLKFRFEQGPKTDKVDFDGNNHAVEAIFWLGSILIAFGWLAYNFLPAAQNLFDAKTVDGVISNPITLYMLVLSAAGVAFFWWAAKSNYIKGFQANELFEEKKRQFDQETEQRYLQAAEKIKADSEPEINAGLTLLYRISDIANGYFGQEAFDLLIDFCRNCEAQNIHVPARVKALERANVLFLKYKYKFGQKLTYTGQGVRSEIPFYDIIKNYINCTIVNSKISRDVFWSGVTIRNCSLEQAYLVKHRLSNDVDNDDKITIEDCRIISCRYNGGNAITFNHCDFSGCDNFAVAEPVQLEDCYYYADNPPTKAILSEYRDVLEVRRPAWRNDSKTIGAQ